MRLVLKKKTFFSSFNENTQEKPPSLEKEQVDNLMKEINFYELQIDRYAIDDYGQFDENEDQIECLQGLMNFLQIKPENEENLDDLKKFLKDKWKLFKEKKKFYKYDGKIYFIN